PGQGLAGGELGGRALDGEIGIAPTVEPHRRASDGPDDVAAARLADGMHNRIFLDPLFRGGYPADVLEHLASLVDLDYIQPGDESTIAAPTDFLGVNYYRPSRIGARSVPVDWTVWPGDGRIDAVPQQVPQTAMGWPIDPSGLLELLRRLGSDYGVPLVITENGAAFDDVVDADGSVHDRLRLAYLDQHVRAVHQALEDGVDLRGYFVWSLLDNFEWAEGYGKRFGIVYVDYASQRRIPKDSARWY